MAREEIGGLVIVTRGDIVDILHRDDECVVLTNQTCLRLTTIPTTVLRALDEPCTLDGLVARLEAEFGPSPRGRLEEILEQLDSYGLVRCDPPHAPSSERVMS